MRTRAVARFLCPTPFHVPVPRNKQLLALEFSEVATGELAELSDELAVLLPCLRGAVSVQQDTRHHKHRLGGSASSPGVAALVAVEEEHAALVRGARSLPRPRHRGEPVPAS